MKVTTYVHACMFTFIGIVYHWKIDIIDIIVASFKGKVRWGKLFVVCDTAAEQQFVSVLSVGHMLDMLLLLSIQVFNAALCPVVAGISADCFVVHRNEAVEIQITVNTRSNDRWQYYSVWWNTGHHMHVLQRALKRNDMSTEMQKLSRLCDLHHCIQSARRLFLVVPHQLLLFDISVSEFATTTRQPTWGKTLDSLCTAHHCRTLTIKHMWKWLNTSTFH